MLLNCKKRYVIVKVGLVKVGEIYQIVSPEPYKNMRFFTAWCAIRRFEKEVGTLRGEIPKRFDHKSGEFFAWNRPIIDFVFRTGERTAITITRE